MRSILTVCLAISFTPGVARPQPPQLSEASERMRAGDYAGARPILEALIAQSPELPESHNLLGVCLLQLKDPTGSAANLDWR